MVGMPGVKVPVVETSVSVVEAPVEIEVEVEVPTELAGEVDEERVEDVPVVEASEELLAGSVTSNC